MSDGNLDEALLEEANEEIKNLNQEKVALETRLAEIEKDLPNDDVEAFEDSARFVTSYIAMCHRRNMQLELAQKQVAALESELASAYTTINAARDTALAKLSDMPDDNSSAAMCEVIDMLPEKIDDAKSP